MGEQSQLNAVMKMLTQWVTAVKLRNAVNYIDINRTSENLALRLLNAAYGYELENLNWNRPNYPAVDLGDHNRGIVFQVTATSRWVKIRETLERFYARDGPHKEFSEGVYFFFIRETTPTFTESQRGELQRIAPGFDPDIHMISMREMLGQIERLYSRDIGRFNKVKRILEEEFEYGSGRINRHRVLEELYQGSRRYLANLRGSGQFRNLKISDTLLTPARLSQRQQRKQNKWLEMKAVVDGQEPGSVDNNMMDPIVPEVVPGLWREICPHALLKGEGGMGKTVSFIRIWEQYTLGEDYNPLLPVPVFIPLNEYNETDETDRREFIQRLIRRFYLEENSRDLDLLNVFRESLNGGKNDVPSVLLLLDGLNEVTVERRGLEIELREMIRYWRGVQLLVSSRQDVRDTMGWTDFHLLELKGLGKKQINQYLGKGGLSPLAIAEDDGKNRFYHLLQNPMMLTIYKASCEVVKDYEDNLLCNFKQRMETPGELLWNFMEAQMVKYVWHSGLEERQGCFYKFLLKMLLPALGYEMEKAGRFQLLGGELDIILKRYLNRFCQADFLSTFREYRGHTSFWSISGCNPEEVFGKVESILNILSCEMSMLVKEGHSYRFLHQDFRDFFAAVHILNEVAIGCSRNEVADVLTGGIISFYPRRYMGEIEGEYYCKPLLEEGTGWQIQSDESTLLAQALEQCRGNFGAEYAYAVLNILETWKELRGEWSGLDLSSLDLSKVLINGTVCSRFYGTTYLAARFDGSLIPVKSIFSEGHIELVSRAVYSPDGQKILSASGDGTIKEWDVGSGTCLRTYQEHKNVVNMAIYSHKGKKILSVSADKTIKEWDVDKGICIRTFEGHENVVTSAVYSPDGKKILSASADKTIKEWDVESGICLRTYQGHENVVTSVVYSPNGKKILSASVDKTIKEWDVESGICLRTYQGHENVVTSVVYSSNGKKILSASKDKKIREWDVTSGKCLQTYQGHKDVATSAVYSPDGKKILSASGDEMIKEWDVASGICLRTYQGHIMQVTNAVYSLNGQKILSASTDKTIKEWDAVSSTCLRTYHGYEDFIESAVYRKDGKKILCASDDKTIKEWDVDSGTCQRIYQGHTHWIEIAVYDPSSKKILSFSYDKQTKEWEVGTGRCLETWHKKDEAPLGHYPDFYNNIKIFNNKLIKTESNEIKIIDRHTGKILRTLENIPGLFIQGCSFKNLHLQSRLNDEDKELLTMYGAIV